MPYRTGRGSDDLSHAIRPAVHRRRHRHRRRQRARGFLCGRESQRTVAVVGWWASDMQTILLTLVLGLATPLVGDGLQAVPPRMPAQTGASAHRMPMIPSEILVRPIDVRTGIGQAHDAIEGISPEAQTYYDQGLSYLHNYVWIEAARSFNQALRLDSHLALAYVGLSVAHDQINQRAAAHDMLDRARRLQPAGHTNDGTSPSASVNWRPRTRRRIRKSSPYTGRNSTRRWSSFLAMSNLAGARRRRSFCSGRSGTRQPGDRRTFL